MSTADATTQPRILFVDDRISDLWALRNTMAARGFILDIASDPRTALEMARARQPDVAVLDYAMEPYNGVALCEKLKDLYPDLYVIFVTSHADNAEIRKRCLDVGDKLLAKDYTGEELVESIFIGYAQRGGVTHPTTPATEDAPPVAPGREPPAADLTPKEWLLLKALKNGVGETVSRDELIDLLWNGAATGSGALEKTISRLRRKIEPDPKHPRIIFTFREDGYFLDLPALRRTHGDRY